MQNGLSGVHAGPCILVARKTLRPLCTILFLSLSLSSLIFFKCSEIVYVAQCSEILYVAQCSEIVYVAQCSEILCVALSNKQINVLYQNIPPPPLPYLIFGGHIQLNLNL
jgi:hypothetical protein